MSWGKGVSFIAHSSVNQQRKEPGVLGLFREYLHEHMKRFVRIGRVEWIWVP